MLVDIGDLWAEREKNPAKSLEAYEEARDLKPDNVLIAPERADRSEFAMITDFGIARASVGDASTTSTLMGTPAYMAPEQLAGDVVDARSDQFAFCVVAWECLFGKRPFTGSTIAAIAGRCASDSAASWTTFALNSRS